MKKGFTLIELLVVVLIISILAAIAVPQYQKAVRKSALQDLIIQGRALMTAQREYILTNGSFATDLNLLSLTFPNNQWFCRANFCQNPSIYNKYHVYLEVNQDVNEKILLFCIAFDDKAKETCLDLGGKYYKASSEWGTTYYTITNN